MIYDKLGRTAGQQLIYDAQFRDEASRKVYEDEQANKSYDYLKNNVSGINYWLTTYLKKMINSNTFNKMPLVTLNYVPKIIRRLTLVYKNPPLIDITDENYEKLLPMMNVTRKEFHRQGKMFNTILVRPIHDGVKIRHSIMHRGICDIETKVNDHLTMTQIKYSIPVKKEKKTEYYDIFWTDENHWAEKDGKVVQLDFMPTDNKNPYGKIPFVVLRFEEAADFWGDGLADLVLGNEHLNGRLTDTFFKLYMSFGIPVGTNLNIKASDFYISPDQPIMIDNVRGDMQTPSLQFITPEHKVELDKEVNDWFKKELGVSKGLSASSFEGDTVNQSGYAKMLDNLENIDNNQDDKEILRAFEKELFEMQKLVLSVDSKNEFDGIDFNMEFAPFEFPKSEDEIWLKRDKEFQYNLSSPMDWLRETRPDATDTELEEVLRANKGLKKNVVEPDRPKSRLIEMMESEDEE